MATPKITKSSVAPFFKVFGVFWLFVGGLFLLIALAAALQGDTFHGIAAGFAGLNGVALVIFGLLYVGLAEICDHISISANNSRVAAEELMKVNSNLAELIRIQKGGS